MDKCGFHFLSRAGESHDAARILPVPPIRPHGAVGARDKVYMDAVDSRAEDHVGDETRYRLLAEERVAVARQI